MWTREIIKERAKNVLSKSYWTAFLISLILTFFAGGNNNGFSFNFSIPFNPPNNSGFGSENIPNQPPPNFFESLPVFAINTSIIFALLMIIFAICYRTFLGNALITGGKKFFVQSAQNNVNMNNIGFSFNKQRYMDIVKSMLCKDVLIFLWTLLLIVPGIIKWYAYFMVPYILADNPNIGYRRALELSENMTEGHKLDMFVLDLSFLGWLLLGLLACLIGQLFVIPYIESTYAQLYLILRKNALEKNLCTMEELGLVVPQVAE